MINKKISVSRQCYQFHMYRNARPKIFSIDTGVSFMHGDVFHENVMNRPDDSLSVPVTADNTEKKEKILFRANTESIPN